MLEKKSYQTKEQHTESKTWNSLNRLWKIASRANLTNVLLRDTIEEQDNIILQSENSSNISVKHNADEHNSQNITDDHDSIAMNNPYSSIVNESSSELNDKKNIVEKESEHRVYSGYKERSQDDNYITRIWIILNKRGSSVSSLHCSWLSQCNALFAVIYVIVAAVIRI